MFSVAIVEARKKIPEQADANTRHVTGSTFGGRSDCGAPEISWEITNGAPLSTQSVGPTFPIESIPASARRWPEWHGLLRKCPPGSIQLRKIQSQTQIRQRQPQPSPRTPVSQLAQPLPLPVPVRPPALSSVPQLPFCLCCPLPALSC